MIVKRKIIIITTIILKKENTHCIQNGHGREREWRREWRWKGVREEEGKKGG